MGMFDGMLLRLLLRLTLVLVLLLAAGALSVTGLVWLMQAMTLALTPPLGAATAHALAGMAALLPLLLLITVLALLARQTHRRALGDGMRQSIRHNPWESLGMAFFLGFTQQGRHPERARLLLEMLRHGQPDRNETAPAQTTAQPAAGRQDQA